MAGVAPVTYKDYFGITATQVAYIHFKFAGLHTDEYASTHTHAHTPTRTHAHTHTRTHTQRARARARAHTHTRMHARSYRSASFIWRCRPCSCSWPLSRCRGSSTDILGCRSPSPLPLSPVRPARVQPCNKHALSFSLGIPTVACDLLMLPARDTLRGLTVRSVSPTSLQTVYADVPRLVESSDRCLPHARLVPSGL